MKKNPFLISGYISPEFFCDREAETENILDSMRNHRNITLFSPRRIGKTGLIKHAFFLAKQKKQFTPVYTDILATGSLKDFTENIGKAVLSALAKNESGFRKILKKLALIRPKAAIDPVSGEPYISISVSSDREAEESLDTVFRYMHEQQAHFVLAIDEFQQIADYPEKNVEALIRTHVQQTQNISIIFSGSRKHILTRIFTSPDRPFFNSTQIMEIGRIDEKSYKKFISDKFLSGGITVESPAIDYILEITSGHTYYVQYLCNRLYGSGRKVSVGSVKEMLLRIINENEAIYASYITLLTPLQFRLLRAVAINGGVNNPTSGSFLNVYDLGAASSVSLAIKSLSDKEFLDHLNGMYSLNDVFFSLWLNYKSGVF